jgi:hypothetical protein
MEYPKWSNDSGIRVYNLQSEIRILQLVRPTFLWMTPNRNIPSLTPQPSLTDFHNSMDVSLSYHLP